MQLLNATRQHNVVPEPPLVADVTHVALAFIQSPQFNEPEQSEWPLFTTVDRVRSQFAAGTVVMIAIGGWGDTKGFSEAAATHDGRVLFARNVKSMLDHTGADGVDVDWEYPGGNGEDYKQTPNAERVWEIEAYPKLLAEIRSTIGPNKLISVAVPGLRRDMMAFTDETVPKIGEKADFFNVMTYDLMNRRDNHTKHHAGTALSLEAVDAYLEKGLPPAKANLGFAFYVKWFKTDPEGGCDKNPVGCRTVLMEDPVTGADLGKSGGFSWHDRVPAELSVSFDQALAAGQYDEEGGGHYFWDRDSQIWWTWESSSAITKKLASIMEKRSLGGVFAWGLGEDAGRWTHLKALTAGYQGCTEDSRGLYDEGPRSQSVLPPRGKTEL